MAVITYGNHKTNVEPGTDIFDYVTEINKTLGSEQLIVECDTHTTGIWRKRVVKKYRAYWDLHSGEYQIIMAATGESGRMEAYLIGILTGMDKRAQSAIVRQHMLSF